MASKQSILIGVLAGAFAVAAGTAGYLYGKVQATSVGAQAKAVTPVQATAAPAASVAVQQAAAPDGVRAITDIFGTAPQAGALATANSLTKPWYAQTLARGQEQLHIVFSATQELDPATRKPVDAHAQAPAISAAVYRLQGNDWQLESTAKAFAQFGAWGEAGKLDRRADVVTFPSGVLGLLLDTSESGQGYTEVGKRVWAYSNREWRDLGLVQTGGDNDGAAVDDKDRYEFKGTVSVLPGVEPFPDLRVARTGTNRDDSGKIGPAKDTAFHYNGKEYVELSGSK